MSLEGTNSKAKRSKEELILMFLSGASAAGILPFFILRTISNEWSSAIFNLFVMLIFSINGLYVYLKRTVKIPRQVFAFSLSFAMVIGFYLKGPEQLPWSYPALVAIFFAVRPKTAAILTSICIFLCSIFLFPLMTTFKFLTFFVTITFTCLFIYIFASLSRQQRIALIDISRRDPLTNLLNRRAFEHKLDEIIGPFRKGQRTSLILFDIDHFKVINDKFGHPKGDEVLYKLGRLILQRMRKVDRFYRIGGEEFAVVLANSTSVDAKNVAEDLRSIVEQAKFVDDHTMTISLGVAQYIENEPKDYWLKRCDQVLYLAKNTGRNNFKIAKINSVS